MDKSALYARLDEASHLRDRLNELEANPAVHEYISLTLQRKAILRTVAEINRVCKIMKIDL